MQSLDVEYDVAIIGGGPIGLSAAYELACRRGKTVLLVEKRNVLNQWGSSPGFGRQWRVPYAEKWLAQLAVQASSAWDDLMLQTSHPRLVDRTGVLWFGDPTRETAEGQIAPAKKNMEELKQEFSYYDKADDIRNRFPWISVGLTDNTVALFVSDGGTVDIKSTVNALLEQIFASGKVIVKEKTKITKIENTAEGVTLTSKDKQVFKAKKLILTPGVYINQVLDSFSPQYPERLNLMIYLWSSVYYKLAIEDKTQVTSVSGRLPRPSSDKWPVWIYFGPPTANPDPSKPANGNSYYGFPSDVRDAPFEVRVCPGFTSENKFDYLDYPPKIKDRRLDDAAVEVNDEFVKTWMGGWVDSTKSDKKTTCVAGFAQQLDNSPDPGQGFVLDFLPKTNNNIVICTGGWAMKFVPLFGRIVADLALDGAAPDYDIWPYMSWGRGIAKPVDTCSKGQTGPTCSHTKRFKRFANLGFGQKPNKK